MSALFARPYVKRSLVLFAALAVALVALVLAEHSVKQSPMSPRPAAATASKPDPKPTPTKPGTCNNDNNSRNCKPSK